MELMNAYRRLAKPLLQSIFVLWGLAAAQVALSDNCSDVFSAATNGSTGFSLTPLVNSGTNSISTGNDGSLALTAGQNYDYSSITANNRFEITVTGSGTARLHLTGSLDLNNDAEINVGGDPEDLVIYVNGNVDINNGATINALIYANGNIDINNNGSTNGSLAANGSISLGSHSVSYDASAVSAADFAGMCSGASTPASLIAEYRLDTTGWNGTADEIIDATGNGHHGVVISNTTARDSDPAIAGDPGTCGYASQSSGAIAISGLPVDTSLGAKTTVAFWMNWSGTEGVMPVGWNLHDLWFYNGSFGFNSANYDIYGIASSGLANGWHHVVAEFTNGDLTQNRLYIDGVEQTLSQRNTSPVNSRAYVNSDFRIGGWAYNTGYRFDGLIDEVRIYDGSLSTAEVQVIMNDSRACTSSVPEPLAEWRMDELSWNGTASEVADSSGSGNNGTAINGLLTSSDTPAITGNPGTCSYGEFDGVDDYIALGNPAALNFTGEITMSAWIRPDIATGRYNILSHGYRRSPDQDLYFRIWEGAYEAGSWAPVSLVRATIPAEDIGSGNWVHLAATYDGTAWNLYRNGTLFATSTESIGAITVDQNWSIGATGAGDERFFDGGIDEVRIYDTALTEAEIQAVMNETRVCSLAPTAEWRMDELVWSGTADEVSDSSGNNYHGTAINTTTAAGLLCNAADLSADGTSDYISVDSQAMNGLSDFTVSVWAQSSTSDNWHTILSGAAGNFGLQANELIMLFDGTTTFRPIISEATFAGSPTITTTAINDGNWHHYVWSRNASNGESCFYRDGVLQGCVNQPDSDDNDPLSIASGGLIVGQDQDTVGGGFESSQDWEGLLDELLVFDYVVDATIAQQIYTNQLAGNNWDGSTRTCPVGGPARLDVVVSGTGSTCLPKDITVRACADAACNSLFTSYAGTVSLSTSTNNGDWSTTSANGTLVPGSSDSGAAAFTFVPANAGTMTLQLENSRAETLLVSATDTGDGSLSDSESLTFSDNVFVISDIDTLADSDVAIAGRNHRYQVDMVRRDTSLTPSTCGVATAYNSATQSLKAWVTRTDGLPAPASPTINGVSIPDTASATIQLDFGGGAGGSAEFDLASTDVGRYSINLLDDSDAFADVDIAGSSDELVVRPFGFAIGVSGAAFSTDATGGVFITSGTSFATTITAVQWESGDDADGDGIPNSGANLSNNSATNSFGLEGESASLTHSLVLPTTLMGGDLGALDIDGSYSVFSNGQSTRNVSWDEVGIINLTANLADGDYLGSGQSVTGQLNNLGRFTPAYFTVSTGMGVVDRQDIAGCSDTFTYLGEPFGLELEISAREAGGELTANYREFGGGTENFAKLNQFGELGIAALASGNDLTARISEESAVAFDWNARADGSAVIDLVLSVSRNVNVDGPFNAELGVVPSDDDSVSIQAGALDMDVDGDTNDDHQSLDTIDLRYGRLNIENAFGPQTRGLPVPVVAEYYNGAAFIKNVNDNCTPITSVTLDHSPHTADDLDIGETTATLPTLPATPVQLGEENISLSAPGLLNSGSVDVSADTDSWLEFNWDGSGDTDPVGTATFGTYRSNDRVIYRNEVLR